MIGRQRLSYAIKITVSHALYYVGLLQLWQLIALRRKAVVLMYHRVLTADERRETGSHPALVVDRETFEKQMAFLKRRFVVLSIEEFAERMEKKVPFPTSSCIVTFDDGWRDNFTNAFPILLERRLPALIFLPMNYIGHDRLFWQEALVHLLVRVVTEVRREPGCRARFEPLLVPAQLETVLDLAVGDPRPSIIGTVSAQKRLARTALEQLVTALADALGVRLDDLSTTDGFIDWKQVAAMSRQGITFGGHGVEHLLLTHVSGGEAENEIRGSKAVMDDRFKETVPTFSYPNGYWAPDVAARVQAAGYRLAFIAQGGAVTCNDDPLTLRRVNIQESGTHTTPMFLARLVGLF